MAKFLKNKLINERTTLPMPTPVYLKISKKSSGQILSESCLKV